MQNTGYHRKYALRLLNHPPDKREKRKRHPPCTYTASVKKALLTLWRAANCICGKRLVPFLPELIAVLERHHELDVEADTRALLLQISPATVDRLLRPERRGQKRLAWAAPNRARCSRSRSRCAPLPSGMRSSQASWRSICWPIVA